MCNLFRKESVIIVIFLAAICAPLMDMFLHLDPFQRLYENREPAKRPLLTLEAATLQKFPREYTQYFNDFFGFRNALVRVNYLARKDLLNTSPSREVVLGADGWLFYAGEGELADCRGITQYDSSTLEKWATSLELKRKWLAQKGVHYLFVVAPNKSTMYGEFLPAAINRVREQTGLDELICYLRSNTKVDIVDLRQPLRAASRTERTFHKTDTHWNDYGAFTAYQEIMSPIAHWFPSVSVYPYDSFTVVRKNRLGGDLASMIGGKEYLEEYDVALRSVKPRLSKILEKNLSPRAPFSMVHSNHDLPRAIVYRDSFLSAVIPFMSEHFQFVRYYWQRWDASTPIHEVVRKHKPDLVIEEVVERLLKNEVPNYSRNYPVFLNDHYKIEYEAGIPVYSLTRTAKYRTDNNSKTVLTDSHIAIVAGDSDPQLLVEGAQLAAHKLNIVKIYMHSSVDSVMQLFYKNENDPEFTEVNSVKAGISKGDNILFLPIKAAKFANILRIDPATVPGKFILKEMEIRSVPE